MPDVIDGLNHLIERWTFANAAARLAVGNYLYQDLGKIAYQSDNGTYWRLIDIVPTWMVIGEIPAGGTTGQVLRKNTGTDFDAGWGVVVQAQGGMSIGGVAAQILTKISGADYDASWKTPASLQTNAANPAGTTSTAGVMMGLGSGVNAAVITPTMSGRVCVGISGDLSNNTAGNGASFSMRIGVGTAPANGAAITGSGIGGQQTFTAPGAGYHNPVAKVFLLTGLTIGTTYWIDAVLGASVGGTASLISCIIAAFEF